MSSTGKARTLTRLLMILASLSIGLVISSTATGQTIGSVATSQTTRAASDSCEDQLKVALERLDKTLDAYEKATKALGFAQDEISARKQLDVLKDQVLAVKDLIIAEQDKLIKRLMKNDNSLWGRVKKILSIAEKALMIGIGVYIGKGL